MAIGNPVVLPVLIQCLSQVNLGHSLFKHDGMRKEVNILAASVSEDCWTWTMTLLALRRFKNKRGHPRSITERSQKQYILYS